MFERRRSPWHSERDDIHDRSSALTRSFLERQRDFFDLADEEHFVWQTRNPYIARTERELLLGLQITSARDVLEVGCGEGGNITNVVGTSATHARIVGLDLFERKVRFAQQAGVPGRFVCGDALRLPFADSAFDLVLCRDVLHHVADRAQVVSELRRVCRTGGAVWIIEPNGSNPLMRLLAAVRPHERGLLGNSLASLRRLVAPHFPAATYEFRQPLPIYRLLLHYRFGIPRLAGHAAFARAMTIWDAIARRVMPRSWWAYVVIHAEA